MRRLFLVLCLIGYATHAAAGDFDVPTLRGSSPFVPGPPKYMRWAGFYFGGQGGRSSAGMDFSRATKSLVASALSNHPLQNSHPSVLPDGERVVSDWPVLGTADVSGMVYGGFVGYNSQWDDVVLGIDVNYNRGNFFADAPQSPIHRVVNRGGTTYDVSLDGSASMRITDYASARLRAGWSVSHFLPYATFGFAVGRADVSRSAQGLVAENPPTGYPTVACDPLTGCAEFLFSGSDAKTSAWIYGWSTGAGIDFLVMPNFFVRAEYEYLSFAKVQGIEAVVHTARIGAGIKF